MLMKNIEKLLNLLIPPPQTENQGLQVQAMGKAVSARGCCCKFTVVVALCLAGAVFFWPWSPQVRMAKVTVRQVKVHPLPPVRADVWISVAVRVQNRDVYWMDLEEVDVGVKYRGKKLGHVESKRWHVRRWGTIHAFGELESSALPSADVAHLLQDLSKGKVFFHTVTEVTGYVGFLSFPLPIEFKAVLACDVLVNTKNHTIIHQHCVRKD